MSVDRKNVNLDKEMQPFLDDLDARICYEYFDGVCYLNEEALVVICNMPDDSGVWVDNDDEEEFVKINELYVTSQKLEAIRELRGNYR